MYEELKKLKKVLVNDSFKFIIIEYGNYSVISEVKEFLASNFPQKKQIEFSSEIKSYNQLLNGIKELDNGFVLINDFESYLDNENIYSGLNQKRDSLSQFKIALICFVHMASEEQVLQKCHINIPDLWEFRNLILKIEGNRSIQDSLFIERFDNNYSSLGGTSTESKQEEIAEIELRLSNLEEIPENYPLIINLYFQLVKILESLTKYDKMLECALKAKVIIEKVIDPCNPYIAISYYNLAKAYIGMSDFSQALIFAQEAKEEFEKKNTPNDPALAAVYSTLGIIYQADNDLETALLYAQKATSIWENQSTPDFRHLATAFNNLGSVYQAKKDYKTALEYTYRAEKMWISNLSSDLLIHPDLAATYNNLGTIYQDMGDFTNALKYAFKAKNMWEKLLPDFNNADLSITYNNLGVLYFKLKMYKESLLYFTKTKKILEYNFPKGHPNIDNVNKWLDIMSKK